mmetsp:Transcript_54020/g.81887  ORF Transcript_54020/g.81887 Transcript_54020/m.81887 type:complete len:278 (+) Transcript_54020:166-999(+)
MPQLLKSLPLEKLERSLRLREPVPPKSSWERETGRGVSYKFGKYSFTIISSSGADESIVIEEDCSIIATRVWDCAALTAKWIESISTKRQPRPNLTEALALKNNTNGKKRQIQVLELGAGLGLLSVCLAKMGAAVMSSEYGVAVRYLKESCDSNNVTVESDQPLSAGGVKCRELDWFKTEETLESLFLPGEVPIFDLIVVTDCTLAEKEAHAVAAMFHKYGTKGHTKGLAGACIQREGTPSFIKRVQEDFDNVVVVPTSEQHPQFTTPRHTILKFDI